MRRIEFLGCPVDCVTSSELLDDLREKIRSRCSPRIIQFVNANKVAMVRRDATMGEILNRSDYVLADGQPMLPMAAMLGLSIPERIDGIGLMHKILDLAHREQFSIYLLGAHQETLEKCVRRIGNEYSGLRVAGFRNGYFSEPDIPQIAAEIRSTSPDFLFLGIGSPMKERFADEWRHELGARVIQGVGGSFEVMAGMVKRAPVWMQRCCMEWLYRVIQEPRRMFWRYATSNGSCLWIFFQALGNRCLTAYRKPLDKEKSESSETNEWIYPICWNTPDPPYRESIPDITSSGRMPSRTHLRARRTRPSNAQRRCLTRLKGRLRRTIGRNASLIRPLRGLQSRS
jgi:N-acetylglucosaminyldiphosphoundecaprenol N-acetyl-beta-D-mannosaminyltransferase